MLILRMIEASVVDIGKGTFDTLDVWLIYGRNN